MKLGLILLTFTIGNLAMSASLKPVRDIEGITEYQLANGLRVLLFPDASQATVTVNITYLVGSRHEGRGEAGMAHLLEHMLFKGTPKHPDSKQELQQRGAFFNATTWFDRTNYFETLPASEENLKFGLEFEADRMVNAWVRQQDLDSEMTVVRNEFEIGENDPISVLHDQMMSAAFRWHNYGKTTIGNRSDIERVPVPNLQAFYKKYYQPDNAVLIVAGKFDPAKALALVQDYFGKLPKPTRELDSTYTEEPTQDGSRFVKLMRSGEVAAAGVLYHIPAASSADFAAIRVLIDVLAQEPGGYLYDKLVKTGKASDIFGMAYQLAEPGALMVLAKPVKNDQIDALKDELIHDTEHPEISAEAVERAKTKLLKNYKIAASNSKDLALRLSESIAQGDYRLYFWQRDQIKEVKLEDVRRVAKHYLIESNRTAGVFVPTDKAVRAEIPKTPVVAEMLKGYVSGESQTEGEHFEATAANIDRSTQKTVLDNGIKIALLPKQTRGDLVKANLIFRYGTAESLAGKREELEMLPQLMMRGTEKKTFQQIQDELDGLQSALQIGGMPGKTVVSITTDKAHVNQVIALLGEIMKTPALSEAEFEIVRKKELADLEEALQDPKTLGFIELERLQSPWPKDSIHYVPNVPERIELLKNMKLAELKKLYREFYGANHLELAVVGSFDAGDLKAELNKHFGTWKSDKPYARITRPYKAAVAELKVIKTPDKQMALLALGMNFALQDTMPEYPAVRIAGYILGESMNSRLWHRLREKGGLSYGTGSQMDVSKFEPSATLSMFAMAATDNADKALHALQDEYHKWSQHGITEKELADSKKSLRSTVENMWANDNFVVSNLAANLELDRGFEFQARTLDAIDKLTVKDVQAALDKYIKPQGLAEVKAGDFK